MEKVIRKSQLCADTQDFSSIAVRENVSQASVICVLFSGGAGTDHGTRGGPSMRQCGCLAVRTLLRSRVERGSILKCCLVLMRLTARLLTIIIVTKDAGDFSCCTFAVGGPRTEMLSK